MKNVVKPRATCKILSLKLVIFIVKTNVSKLSKYSKSIISQRPTDRLTHFDQLQIANLVAQTLQNTSI